MLWFKLVILLLLCFVLCIHFIKIMFISRLAIMITLISIYFTLLICLCIRRFWIGSLIISLVILTLLFLLLLKFFVCLIDHLKFIHLPWVLIRMVHLSQFIVLVLDVFLCSWRQHSKSFMVRTKFRKSNISKNHILRQYLLFSPPLKKLCLKNNWIIVETLIQEGFYTLLFKYQNQ